MNRAVIITAGGIGSRMKINTPKQFLELGSIPVLMITIKAFFHFDPKILIVITLPQNSVSDWEKLLTKHNFLIPHSIVIGGETRFHSIKNALPYIKSSDYVAIHDGVRPFVSQEMINDAFQTAHKYDSAIPITAVNDSLRIKNENEFQYINRDLIFSVQTPQCFHTDKIVQSYSQEFSHQFTDDASVFETMFDKLHFYKGINENIKITNPTDIVIAEALSKFFVNKPSFPQF